MNTHLLVLATFLLLSLGAMLRPEVPLKASERVAQFLHGAGSAVLQAAGAPASFRLTSNF